ncbi:hypothetical protein EPUS_08147 [Endocarpon pusillum Z07020]|uniref:AB hydrolase-1 domain-containing protein n=1 Tax=Endocarpon pusillum (strain Z07020 / HMAS-L-300199) TaxID=1263415 RepID=U1HQ86_ENDPU|nr:uncharacterized protein EPUS_08147 [Endocarpon pusillum Z07020]ERF71229.1 hypothetical protein EPUS_08147 [Endocarpon pusillum Z07020]
MSVDKINVWDDPRVQKRSAHLNGRTYGYLYGEPREGCRGTIFLVYFLQFHGFPDISMGWRYQIPMLLSLGLRVVAPDCMGYGRTDAPPYTLRDYGFKRISDDMAELARQLGVDRIIIGGHDWGGGIVYRFAFYHPTLVTHVFSICTPYLAPQPTYTPLKLLTRTTVPNFSYQHQFSSGAIEESIQTRSQIKSFLNAAYGGKPADPALVVFNPNAGFNLAGLEKLGHTPSLSEEELEYYASEFSRNGLHGPCNWYRTHEINWEDEWEYIFRFGEVKELPRLEQEVLFVLATKDEALRPEMARHMVEGGEGPKGLLPRLRRREVEVGHFAHWESPAEVNEVIKGWVEEVVFGCKGEGGGKERVGTGSKL